LTAAAERKERTIYHWKVPDDHPNFTGHDDVADEYRVIENLEAARSIVVEGKYRGEWIANPWSTRALIRHLLEEKD
jgi:hypothetical protein